MNQLTTLNPQALELLKGSFQLIQLESFFDVDPSEPKMLKKLWTKPKDEQIASLSEKILLENTMEKREKRTNRWISRHYILTSDFLAYKEVYFSSDVSIIFTLENTIKGCKENNVV